MAESVLFFAAVPIICQSPPQCLCYCYYHLYHESNIYNCSSTKVKSLPSSVPHSTDWLVMKSDPITKLSASYGYLDRLKFLNLENSNIRSISKTFLHSLQRNRNLTWINLAGNKLVSLPQKVQDLVLLEKVWLGGNPFHCDCSMTWMIGWLNNFTSQYGNHVIVDYKFVKCASGLMVGRAICNLNKVDMGCFPRKWTIWQKVGVGIGAAVATLIILALTVVIIKRSRDIKFFFHYYFKWWTCFGVPKDDTDEDLSGIEYDAYLSYR